MNFQSIASERLCASQVRPNYDSTQLKNQLLAKKSEQIGDGLIVDISSVTSQEESKVIINQENEGSSTLFKRGCSEDYDLWTRNKRKNSNKLMNS